MSSETVKTSRKNAHANVVCRVYIITDKFKYTSKHRGPRLDYRSSLIWVHTVSHRGLYTFQQTRKADDFCCDWSFIKDQLKM